MAKSTKHQDKIGTLESFRAPWETESGDEVEVNKSKLKSLLFNLKLGEAKALDAAADAREAETAAITERDEAKTEAANANPAEAQKKIEKLEKERDDLRAERDGLVTEKEQNELRAEVIGSLDPKYAKYVKGATKEELEKSLEEVRKDFDLPEPGEEGEEGEPEVRTTPRTRLNNGRDPEVGKGADVFDADAVADDILAGSAVFR